MAGFGVSTGSLEIVISKFGTDGLSSWNLFECHRPSGPWIREYKYIYAALSSDIPEEGLIHGVGLVAID